MKRSGYVKQGAYLLPPWRNIMLFSQAEWNRQHPKRYTLMIRQALQAARLRHWEKVTVWNEHHHPLYYGKRCAAGFQLLEFVVRIPGSHIPLVLLVKNPASLKYPHERDRWQAKLDLLEERKIPYLILPTDFTSQEYRVRVQFKMNMLKGKS